MRSAFEEEGLVLYSYHKNFYKIYDKEGALLTNKNGEDLPFRYPAADLFIMTLEKRNEIQDFYVHRSFNFYFNWNHDRFNYSQIENITRAEFGPITISIPGHPESYLNRVFGMPQFPDLWKKYAIEPIWDHKLEKWPAYPGAALVEIDDFSPAK
jgi:hypothetical protein